MSRSGAYKDCFGITITKELEANNNHLNALYILYLCIEISKMPQVKMKYGIHIFAIKRCVMFIKFFFTITKNINFSIFSFSIFFFDLRQIYIYTYSGI